jgi:hypothetical protein
VERLLDAHRSGRRGGGDAIWALLNLELWFRTFIDGEGVQTLPEPRTRRQSAVPVGSAIAGADPGLRRTA